MDDFAATSLAELDQSTFRLISVEDYLPLIGAEAVERILGKAEALRDLHVVNINSTHQEEKSPSFTLRGLFSRGSSAAAQPFGGAFSGLPL
jgi:hypothetical protein